MNISIVIPALINSPGIFAMTKELLDGIFFNTTNINKCEVILVDDCSDEQFIYYIKRIYPSLIITSNNHNMGFAKSINRGIGLAKNDLILLLNNDVKIINKGWLNNMVLAMQQKNLDAMALKKSMLDKDMNYVTEEQRSHYRGRKHYYLDGWCMLVKRKVFEVAGLFATDFGLGYWEDTAWSFNLKNYPQFKCGIAEGIAGNQIQHLGHQTFKEENININNQYNKNRKIFIDYTKGRRKLNITRLKEATK